MLLQLSNEGKLKNMRMWRNWQTRWTQNPVMVTQCGFDSHHPHQKWFEYSNLFFCKKIWSIVMKIDIISENKKHRRLSETTAPALFEKRAAKCLYSPSRNSSADRPYSFASAIRFEVDRSDMPFSHLLTACRLTPTASATNS